MMMMMMMNSIAEREKKETNASVHRNPISSDKYSVPLLCSIQFKRNSPIDTIYLLEITTTKEKKKHIDI